MILRFSYRGLLMVLKTVLVTVTVYSCAPELTLKRSADATTPVTYNQATDTTNEAKINWREYFADPNLVALIDTALQNNQEFNIILQELEIARNEVRARKGEYLPFVNIKGGAGMDKVGEYTRYGALEENLDVEPGRRFPEPFSDFMVGAYATWEVDVWRKLRNAKKSAYTRYLSSIEGRNFMQTNLVAEIANTWFELLALDNQLEIIKQNIEIQNDALRIVKLQKQATRVTELAVRRFEAQVFSTRSLQFDIQQKIVETENKLNFLAGRFPQPVERNSQLFNDLVPAAIQTGIPSQLLENRPDIRQAALNLEAAKLDIKVAKANFYPSLGISAGVGYQAFNPAYIIKTPQSLLYSLAGDLTAPLINRNAIKAIYFNASSKQVQAVYDYERSVLNAYIEVANLLAKINNLGQSYDLKSQQVQALSESIDISNGLFKSARADYMEVLLTQRDALESRFELIETKEKQIAAWVDIYRALGGGWR